MSEGPATCPLPASTSNGFFEDIFDELSPVQEERPKPRLYLNRVCTSFEELGRALAGQYDVIFTVPSFESASSRHKDPDLYDVLTSGPRASAHGLVVPPPHLSSGNAWPMTRRRSDASFAHNSSGGWAGAELPASLFGHEWTQPSTSTPLSTDSFVSHESTRTQEKWSC